MYRTRVDGALKRVKRLNRYPVRYLPVQIVTATVSMMVSLGVRIGLARVIAAFVVRLF